MSTRSVEVRLMANIVGFQGAMRAVMEHEQARADRRIMEAGGRRRFRTALNAPRIRRMHSAYGRRRGRGRW